MAKKQKDEVPDPRSVANRDILQRLNYLYQASVYIQGLPGASTSAQASQLNAGEIPSKEKKRKRKTNLDLSRTYVETMKVVSQRAVVRMDPGVKRTICKKCNVILVAGSTATVRMKSSKSHRHIVTYNCTACGTSKRIPASPLLIKADATSQSMEGEQPLEVPNDAKPPTASGINKKSVTHGLPPLSSLPGAGHVVFCGQEKLDIDNEKGAGSFMA